MFRGVSPCPSQAVARRAQHFAGPPQRPSGLQSRKPRRVPIVRCCLCARERPWGPSEECPGNMKTRRARRLHRPRTRCADRQRRTVGRRPQGLGQGGLGGGSRRGCGECAVCEITTVHTVGERVPPDPSVPLTPPVQDEAGRVRTSSGPKGAVVERGPPGLYSVRCFGPLHRTETCEAWRCVVIRNVARVVGSLARLAGPPRRDSLPGYHQPQRHRQLRHTAVFNLRTAVGTTTLLPFLLIRASINVFLDDHCAAAQEKGKPAADRRDGG